MIISSAVESFSVSVQFRMACSVFVQPPVYTMPLTALIALTGVVSADVTSELVANSTTLNRAVFPVPIAAVSSSMKSFVKSFVSV